MGVPQSPLLAYLGIDKPTLPYRTNTSPADDSPHFIAGSVNFTATVRGELAKRPGFASAIETSLTNIPGTISRIYTWKRWAGSTTNPDCFFVMVSTIVPFPGGSFESKVYKINLGNLSSGGSISPDASFSQIYSTTQDPTNNVPFDFQFDNNFVFFGNASTQENMKKYDGTAVTQWGIFPPVSAPSIAIVSGDLPAGITFNPATGQFSGTPANAGETSVTVTVTDAAGETSSQLLNLFVDPPGFRWTTPSGALPIATQGASYTYQLQAQSGTTPYIFSLYSGSLPTGLNLSNSGVISGTPTNSGSSSFAVKVVDSTTPTPVTAIRSFTLFVNSPAIGSLISTSTGNNTVGSYYNTQYAISGGTGTSPYTFALVGGQIPPGLTFTSSGLLSGTPTTLGNYTTTIRVTDSSSPANVAEFLQVIPITTTNVSIVTMTLPNAQAGVPYSQYVVATGGTSPYTFSYTAGSLSAQTGYVYGYTYTSKYGHESSMSPLSDNTGLFTDQNVEVDVIASSDPQVTGINIYRSTDGGDEDPGVMRLIVSLSTNTTQSYEDSTEDQFLGTQTGPGLYVNDVPQPMRGLNTSADGTRIWGFKDATAYFTGAEEITNGSPYESMSDAKNGNFYQWPSEVGAIAITDNGVDSILSEEVWQVSGDTLDTFRKNRILRGAGTLSPTCSLVVGTTVYWIDTAKQVFSSDKGEIGESIRPDLANLVHSQTFIVYYKFQTRNWLMIADCANSQILIYDMDLDQWEPPWKVQNLTCLAAGQTASGTISLIGAFSTGHVRVLTEGTFNDDGNTYGEQIRTCAISIIPGARTNARNTSEPRIPKEFAMEFNTRTTVDGNGNITAYVPNAPDSLVCLPDDDPTLYPVSSWTDCGVPEPLQFGSSANNQLFMSARRWLVPAGISCRRIAFAAIWNPATNPWKVYSFDIARENG
jgi:hypothetical protein